MHSSLHLLRRVTAILSILALTASALAQKVPVVERTLSNGMKLLMVPRHDEPSVSGGWVAHVGSANERPGITGIAHLFEHMMFKGTPTIGTKDYQKDLEIIAEQEKVRDEMRKVDAVMRAAYRRGEIDDILKPENRSARYKELEKTFNELIAKQRDTMVKNEFDRVYTTAGGSGMNATTSTDMTMYFITVPANKTELWMWMEAERLLRPVFREFYAERDVVFEERRLRTEATPLGRLEESFESMVWESHPYGWPVVGWPSDLPAISKAQADEFYGLYYAPQNITVVFVGDFDPEKTTALAERYFGRIPKGRENAPDVVTLEIKQAGEKRLVGEAEANPMVDIVWHTAGFGHKDTPALQVLAQVLSTRTGRLYKGLVLGRKVANEIWARQDARKWAGTFNLGAELKEGQTHETVESALYEELDRLKKEEVPAEELQKVKNNFAADEYRRLASNTAIMFRLLRSDGLGDWKDINEAGAHIQAVTAADIRRVVSKYFTQENRNVGIFSRKAGSTEADPELQKLTENQKRALKQFSDMLGRETDPAKLKPQLENFKQRLETAPATNKALFEILVKRVGERISNLEKK